MSRSFALAVWLLAVLLFVLLLLAACGRDSNDARTDLDAPTLLRQSAQAVQAVGSFHFKLTQENGVIPLPLDLDLDSAEGDVVMPDRLKANIRARARTISVSVDVIAVGGDTWITNPFTRSWQRQSVDLREFADLGELLPAVLPAIRDARVAGQTDIDGVRTYQIEGVASSSELQQALPFSLPNREVRVEVWIGVDDSLPRRLRVVGPLMSGESPEATRQVDLSRFNQRVEINPP